MNLYNDKVVKYKSKNTLNRRSQMINTINYKKILININGILYSLYERFDRN